MAQSNSFSVLLLMFYAPCNHNGSRAFALAFATCRLHLCHGQLYNDQYRMEAFADRKDSLDYQYLKLHTRLLNRAGSERITVTTIDTLSIECTITISWRASKRVNDYYCSNNEHDAF